AELRWISDGRVMSATGRRQPARVPVYEVLCRFQGAKVHGVLIDVLDDLTYSLRSFKVAALFRAVQACHNFRRQNGVDGLVSHPRKYMKLQVPDDPVRVRIRPMAIFGSTLVPRTGHEFKSLKAGGPGQFFLAVTNVLGVLTVGTQAVCFVCLN